METVTNEAIDYAINKFKTFVKVQKQNTMDDRMDAIDLFSEAAGLPPLGFEHLCKKFDQIVESNGYELGWAIVGFLVALFAKEYESDTA